MRDIAVEALEEAKGVDITVLDVTSLTDICDYMLVASGTSDRHIKTLADRVLEDMSRAGWKKMGSEGEEARDWVLVDFVDIVVHIMRAQTRKRYDLESLWDRTFGDLNKQRHDDSPGDATDNVSPDGTDNLDHSRAG